MGCYKTKGEHTPIIFFEMVGPFCSVLIKKNSFWLMHTLHTHEYPLTLTWPNGDKIFHGQGFYRQFFDLDLDSENWFKVIVNPSTVEHSIGDVYALNNDFTSGQWFYTHNL